MEPRVALGRGLNSLCGVLSFQIKYPPRQKIEYSFVLLGVAPGPVLRVAPSSQSLEARAPMVKTGSGL